jgi:hypothetical protein
MTQLKDYLGADYSDDVLPLYIVVMLAHGNNQDLVAENLDAFLGGNDAKDFTKWCAFDPTTMSSADRYLDQHSSV